MINAAKKSAIEKNSFNSGIGGKRFLVGTGYVLYVIPGLVANYYYEGQKTEAENKSIAVYEKEKVACEPSEERLPTSQTNP